MRKETKRRVVTLYHKHFQNPMVLWIARHFPRGLAPGLALIETTGRRSGLPRHTPVGGRLEGSSFWVVTEHGHRASYVRNIDANPRVRVMIGGRWRAGTAHLLPDDDPRQRLRRLPTFNSRGVRLLGTDLLTLRVDLD
jgi:deazaflavin-dependent oxidoreductase (nitroreductase family)